MSRPSDVIKYGTDSSGRTIYMTRYMAGVWAQILADPAVAPFAHLLTIVQGAFMVRNGGGAEDSEGFHDGGGCTDVRTWNLTADQLEAFVRTARRYGWAFWRRDAEHGGMDPHAHGVLGSDYDLASGARSQWQAYLDGHDGLASNGPDYEWRPSPLVLTPPPEDDMFTDADSARLKTLVAAIDVLATAVEKLTTLVDERVRATSYRRDTDLAADIKAIRDSINGAAGKSIRDKS